MDEICHCEDCMNEREFVCGNCPVCTSTSSHQYQDDSYCSFSNTSICDCYCQSSPLSCECECVEEKEKEYITQDDVKEYYSHAFGKIDSMKKIKAGFVSTKCFEEYHKGIYDMLHVDILKKNFGCGTAIPSGDMKGRSVLDLGSGVGREVFILGKLVGKKGKVIGVDMLKDIVKKANSYKDYHEKVLGIEKGTIDFRHGNIEDLSSCQIKDEMVDLVISNCVINLSMNKVNVFKEIYRVLKFGGELFFSDIYVSRKLPDYFKNDKKVYGQCIGGALYLKDFYDILQSIGFTKAYIVRGRVIDIPDYAKTLLKGIPTTFYSLTIRAFKLPKESNIEEIEEDYDQHVVFKGDKYSNEFSFDCLTKFIKGEKTHVSSNIAEILSKGCYSRFFTVDKRGSHLGTFNNSLHYWKIIEMIEKEKAVQLCESSCC